MNPLLEAFLGEARDLLEQAGARFLDLEKSPDDTELVNELFRSVHTIKGASGLFDIAPFTRVVHAAEDVLDRVRGEELILSSEHIDQLLDAMDQVGTWLDDLETGGSLGPEAESIGLCLSTGLREIIANCDDGEAPVGADPKAGEAVAQANPADIPWLAQVPQSLRDGLSAGHEQWVAVSYAPDEQCFFQGHDPLHTVRSLPGMAWFEVVARESWADLAALDPYLCNLEFHALSRAGQGEVEHHLRYVLDQVEILSLPSPVPAQPVGEVVDDMSAVVTPDDDERPALDTAERRAAAELLQAQLEVLSLPWEVELWAGRIQSVATVMARVFPVFGMVTDATIETAKTEALHRRSGGPLRVLIEDLLHDLAISEADIDEDDPVVPALDGTLDVVAGEDDPEDDAAQPAADKVAPKAKSCVLKVDQARIDTLMDLVGELVVAKNALPFLARRAEQVFGVRDLAREIKGQHAVINRLAEDLQHAVMQVRMVPVGTAFQRFPRLVRDLSRKLNKKVRLVVRGEETEADKNVVEDLSDPLIHLIRNSLDHGIETPEARLAAGKPDEAQILLRATQQDDRVVIEISDDGKGIDPEVIKRKAYERGLISEEVLESISDTDALQLIFAAGLSTARQVSDLSGRGVGMDVVRNAVQRAGGNVMVESELGAGTTVRLSLPLSMAVTSVMMVRVGDEGFGVPFEAVRETVRIDESRIRVIKQRETVVLRDRLLPLFRLRNLFRLTAPGRSRDNEDGVVAVLVVNVNGSEVGLVVDDFHEAIDIILKPLEGVMNGFPVYSGTALLGDGRVLLVLNLKELVQCR